MQWVLDALPVARISEVGYQQVRTRSRPRWTTRSPRCAELLRGAGVPVELHNAETLVHGYVSFGIAAPAAAEAFAAAPRGRARDP